MTLLAALTFMPTSAQTPDEEVQIHITQVDTSAFPQVTIYLSVTDLAGEPVGIDPSRLQIYENATAIETDQIEGMGTVGRLSTLLIMDISGSMNIAGKLEAAQAAAQAYIALMRPGGPDGSADIQHRDHLRTAAHPRWRTTQRSCSLAACGRGHRDV